jgi:hypothetical protein
MNEADDDQSEKFAISVASLPNEIFNLIIDRLETKDIVSIWTKVGTTLFTRHVSKRILKRICRLRACNCENFIWDVDNNLESSLFIIWAIILQHAMDVDCYYQLHRKYQPLMDYNRSERLFSIVYNDIVSFKVSEIPTLEILSANSSTDWNWKLNFCAIGDVCQSFTETVYKFLELKQRWYIYRINIWKTRNKNKYEIGIFDYIKPHIECAKHELTTEDICIIRDLLKSKTFQLVEAKLTYNPNHFYLRPQIKMNFEFDPLSNVYARIFGNYGQISRLTWFSRTLALAKHLYIRTKYPIDSSYDTGEYSRKILKTVHKSQRLLYYNTKIEYGDGLVMTFTYYVLTSCCCCKMCRFKKIYRYI